MEPLNRPYLWFANWYARAGDREASEALIAEYESEVSEEYRRGRGVENSYLVNEASLLRSEGKHAEALTLLRQRETDDCGLCGFIATAKIFEALGQADSAIVYYERYFETSDIAHAAWDNENRGPTLERLGQLFDEAGEPEKAAVYYARLVELWKDADPELQPRVQAAQDRLEAIVRERG
jgi:tetratricopeptide (TPR) repeat protein